MSKIKMKYPEVYDLLIRELYKAIRQGVIEVGWINIVKYC